MIPKIVYVEPQADAKLALRYETGEEKIFDVAPYIEGSWFGELGNAEYFSQVCIVDAGSGIEWPDGQDIAPHELYELSTSVLQTL